MSTAVSTDRGLRAVALFEAAKGLLAVLLSAFAWSLLPHHPSTAPLPDVPVAGLMPHLRDWAQRIDPRWIVGGLLAYAALRFLEAFGLWRQQVWAEWLAIISGVIYLPFEVWQLAQHFSWLMLGILAVNLVIVGYLARCRQLAARRRRALAVTA